MWVNAVPRLYVVCNISSGCVISPSFDCAATGLMVDPRPIQVDRYGLYYIYISDAKASESHLILSSKMSINIRLPCLGSVI